MGNVGAGGFREKVMGSARSAGHRPGSQSIPSATRSSSPHGVLDPGAYTPARRRPGRDRARLLVVVDEGVAEAHPTMTTTRRLLRRPRRHARAHRAAAGGPRWRGDQEPAGPGGGDPRRDRRPRHRPPLLRHRHRRRRRARRRRLRGGDRPSRRAPIRIPTTVLAQDDSGVGVKNGINAFARRTSSGRSPRRTRW